MSSALEIATALRADILAGDIVPGEELKQEDLAARFKVSRMPVRDALCILAKDRLVTLRPNRGGKVLALSTCQISEVYDLRILMELDALERSFEHMSQEALQAIELQMKRCEIEADSLEFPQADWRFHEAIYAPAKRGLQCMMIKELRDVCQMHEAAYAGLRASNVRWSQDHRSIVGALKLGDLVGAKAALCDHLGEAQRQLLAFMEADKDE